MLAKGLTVATVAEFTGLSLVEVKKLAAI
jgi:hypothetical protein